MPLRRDSGLPGRGRDESERPAGPAGDGLARLLTRHDRGQRGNPISKVKRASTTGGGEVQVGERQPFKLLQARDARGLVISARQIGQHPEPFTRPLRCVHCEHEVIAQPEQHRVSSKGKPFTRGAHFALAKEKEKGRTAEHLPYCPLRTKHTLHIIARRSQGLAELRDGGLQLRLVLAATADTKAPFLPAIGAPVLPPPADPTTVKIHSVDPRLPPAVTSAVRIAQLLSLYGHDPENLARFTVKHPGLRTPVTWDDFCYGPDPDHLARLYQRLAADTIRHPVAVLGDVTDVRRRGDITSCRIAGRVPTGLPGPLAHADVYLRADAHHRQLLDPLTEGTRVLALAAPDVAWKLWKPTSGRIGHQMVLWPQAHWQVAHWTLDDNGLPTEPRSPNPLTDPAPTRAAGSWTAPSRRPAASAPVRAPQSAQPPKPEPRPAAPPNSRPAPVPPADTATARADAPPAATEAVSQEAPLAPAQPVPPPPAVPPTPAHRVRSNRKGLLARWLRR